MPLRVKEDLSTFLGLRCTRCGAEFEAGPLFEGCPACARDGWAANLKAVYDLDAARLAWARLTGTGVWRYAPLLPLRDAAHRVTLGEGGTPLLSVSRLPGARNFWIKNESTNPTWSYKDRMCTVGVSMAVQLGATTVGISSTGNQGASGSAYAARAGLDAVVLTREDIEDPSLAFMQVYGGLVLRTTRFGRWDLLGHGVRELGWYPISSFTPVPTGNPFAIEGYKTIAYELFEELGMVPDVVVVPTAAGEGLAGIKAGFDDLRAMGLIDFEPRMVAAEPAGGAPLAATIEASDEHVVRVEPYETIATTLGATIAIDRALLAIRTSGGTAIRVSDDDLRRAQTVLLRHGLLAEPAGAAAAAAIAALPEALPGFDPDITKVVVLLTGGGLRSLSSFRPDIPQARIVAPTPEALELAVSEWRPDRSAHPHNT